MNVNIFFFEKWKVEIENLKYGRYNKFFFFFNYGKLEVQAKKKKLNAIKWELIKKGK